MQLFYICSIILLLKINCIIQNTFTIDFSFLLPDSNINDMLIDNVFNESILNSSLSKNFSYYYNIKPMIKFYIGSPLQCFFIQISFNSYETTLDLNSLYFNYKESSSLNLLENINSTYIAASDTIKLGSENKNDIDNFNFILLNGSEISQNKLGLGKSMSYNNIFSNNYDFSLLKQLKDKEMIDTTEITIKYSDDLSGEIILGTNYTGMQIDESQYLELPNTQNTLNGYLQSIYIEDATISTTKKQQKDLLSQEKRKRFKIDFNSTFITLSEEVFEQIKMVSFISYINAGICELKQNEKLGIQYLICNDDILNSNLDTLFIVFNWKKNISVSFNDLFLPYKSNLDKYTNILGIISSKNNETVNVGTVLLKKYMICLNHEKNNIRLYLKSAHAKVVPKDIFGIVGIISLSVIICLLIIYMVITICGKDKYEPNYSPHVKKFFIKKALDKSSQSNESF